MRARISILFSGLTTAVRLLSLLPFPGREASRIAACHPWFPVTGALLGGLLALAGWGVFVVTDGWSGAAALAVVAGGAWLTRGLHLDGLSDCADGFGGGFTPAKRLLIMKDSRVGSFGVVILVIVLLGKWVALVRLIDAGGWAWIVAAYVLSRTLQVLLAFVQPYARPEGGTGHHFVTQATARRTAVTGAIAAVFLLGVVGRPVVLLIAVGGAVLLVLLFGVACRRRVGGVTGDLIGAASEGVELWVLLCAGGLAR